MESCCRSKIELATADDLSLAYEPNVLCVGKVRFYDEKSKTDDVKVLSFLAGSPDDFGRTDWENALPAHGWENKLIASPDHPDTVSVSYHDLPETANSSKEFTSIKKEFSDWLYRSQRSSYMIHDDLEMYQQSGESREQFMLRIQQLAREERDEEMDELKDKYETKFDRLSEKMRNEEQDIEEAESDLKGRRTDELVGVAETIFSVFGRRRRKSFSSVSTKRRMVRKAKQNVEDSREDLEQLHLEYKELEVEVSEKITEIREKWEAKVKDIEEKEIKPRRSDVIVDKVILAWIPYWVSPDNQKVSALK